MRRRTLLGVAAAVVVPGCAGVSSPQQTDEVETTAYTDDPNLTIDFDVLGHECAADDADLADLNEASFDATVDENRVTVTGWIADGEPQRTAVLRAAEYVTEDSALRLDVRTEQSDAVEDCPTRTEYRVRITYEMPEFQQYRVSHNGRRVEAFDAPE